MVDVKTDIYFEEMVFIFTVSRKYKSSPHFLLLPLIIYPFQANTEFCLFALWGVECNLGPLGTSATSGLLYLPRVIVRMENLVE
jgi:hypothetical protein